MDRGVEDALKPTSNRLVVRGRKAALLVAGGLLASLSSGCIVGGVYASKANDAAAAVEQARILNAAALAEYEYTFAQENLKKAMEEAAEASYGDAIVFADLAKEAADRAIEQARSAHRGAGR